jgi:hypothetical protein
MNTTDFLARVAQAIEHEGTLAPGQALDSLPTWDSLGLLNVLDLLEQCGLAVRLDRLQAAQTTDDLLELAGLAAHA